jgi:DNA-binding transcriptional LysR family regulator
MIDLTRLRVFREVAERRSFSAAAAALNYTQSSVSQQITNLERELGVTLIDRGSRPVRLTYSGEVVLRHAEDLLGRVASIERELTALKEGDVGTLRLGGFFTAWTSFLPQAVAAYAHAHSQVQLELRQLEPGPAVRALRAGDLDLAVIYRFDPVEDGVSTIHLFDDVYAVALSAGHLLARRRSIPLKALARERWVSPPARVPYVRVLSRMCREEGFEPDVAFETTDIATVQPLVAAGLAIAVLPLLATSPLLDGVVVRPLVGKPIARTVEIVEPARRRLPAARAMVDAVRESATALRA